MTLNEGYRFRHTVCEVSQSKTCLQYMAERFPHSSSQEWALRMELGEVFLNELLARGGEVLRNGDVIVWNRPPWIEPDVPRHFEVVYRDDSLLVVNKPSGLPTLPGAGFMDNTLLRLVEKVHGSVFPLHRLGRGTSGLVLFAFNKDASQRLSRSWRSIKKFYHAHGEGVAVENHYDIQVKIGPVPHPRLGTVFAASQEGKAAQSIARVMSRGDDSTQFEVELVTGRPHQIRIHLASIDHPLVGDPLYGCGGVPLPTDPGLPGDLGYQLHASRLEFPHPISDKLITCVAPLPANW